MLNKNWQSRTEMVLGKEAVEKLNSSNVAIFGIGGVGSYAAEALARAGIGKLTLVDGDVVSETNINRQLIADSTTIGLDKVEVMKKRILTINPEADVSAVKLFFSAETSDQLDLKQYDYILDCIDTVSSKIHLICESYFGGIPVISSMGAGNKLNPYMFEVDDIYKTSVCPLARIMRSELRKRGVKKLKVVYSKEEPKKMSNDSSQQTENGKHIPGSLSFVPSVAGLIMAGEVVKFLADK